MKQPYSPRVDEPIRAWHLRSHVEAINWLYQAIKNLPRKRAGDGGSGGGSVTCYFGDLETWTEGEGDAAVDKTGIRGGIVYCGDKNFSVPRKELVLTSDGVWIIYLEIDCESNRDDDNEIILPKIKTSSETDPASFWQNDAWSIGPPETQYPDNTNPSVSDGIGTIIIPLGKLTIADGAASFVKVGCGNITVEQCGGTLSHTRG